MHKLIAVMLLCFAAQAGAVELEGAKLEDKAQVGNATLQLNGAGLRSVLSFIKIYVAGLYLTGKQTTSEAVLADAGPKRIALHVVADETGSERLVNGMRKGIEKNHSKAELGALRERIEEFAKLFDAVKTVKRGDVVTLDWHPGIGTSVVFNGKELGQIKGEDFYRALLKVWIGDRPVLDSLKRELLGG